MHVSVTLAKNIAALLIKYIKSSHSYQLTIVSVLCTDIVYYCYELYVNSYDTFSLLYVAIICIEIGTLVMLPFLKVHQPSVARLYILLLGVSNLMINQIILYHYPQLRTHIQYKILIILIKFSVFMNMVNYACEEFSLSSIYQDELIPVVTSVNRDGSVNLSA